MDWKKRLSLILEENAHLTSDKSRVAGFETHHKRSVVLFASFRELRELGYKLNEPKNISNTHLMALVRHWEKKEQMPATIQNKLSIFRVFCEWVGKRGMVLSAESYVSKSGAATRTYVAIEPKGWSAREVDVKHIEQIKLYDLRVGLQLQLCLMFGMRMQESIQFKPTRADKGDYIVVSDGTKGGRARVVPVDIPNKRDLLEQCKKTVGYANNAFMGEPSRTLEQNKRRFYYILDKHGITKEQLGVTAHGLRHQYVNSRYEEITGSKSPVEGGDVLNTHPELDHTARTIIAEEVGHTRPSIVSAYSGSRRIKKKEEANYQLQLDLLKNR